jgi:hypothetical protein
VVRAPGCWSTAGAFLHPRPSLAERDLGAKRAPAGRERKGGPLKVFAKQRTAGQPFWPSFAKTFRVPLRSRVPVLNSCPFARSFSSLLWGQNAIGKGSAYVATGGSRSLLPRCFVRWVTHRASERPFRAPCGTHGSYCGALCGPRSRVAPCAPIRWGPSGWRRLASDLWGRAGERGLEITKLAFLSQVCSRTVGSVGFLVKPRPRARGRSSASGCPTSRPAHARRTVSRRPCSRRAGTRGQGGGATGGGVGRDALLSRAGRAVPAVRARVLAA